MRSFIAAAALLQAFANLASAQVSNDTSSDCPQQGGVHIIVARASLEPVGYGTIGAVKDAVLAQIPGSTAEFVVYPATLNDYTTSESDGVVAARLLINAYIENCPGQPLVVMGYSQGAQVSADSLVGQDVRNFPVNETIQQPLAESTLARTAAVIIMGDPTFVTDEDFHVGNATRNGLFPRQNIDDFETADLGSRTQSYCDAGDPYCAAGNQLIVHVGYVKEYGMDATAFVIKNVAAWYAANGSGSTAGGSAVPSATASRSKVVASSRVPSATAVGSASATASRHVPSASASLSSVPVASSTAPSAVVPTTATSASPSNAISTGAASSLDIAGAGIGAVVAALFAFML